MGQAGFIKNDKKLSITFLDFDDVSNPLLNGGQARATFEVARRLVEKGHSVTVISSKFPGYKDRKEKGIYYKHIGLSTKDIRFNNISYILSIPFAVSNIKNADVILECFTAPISTLFSPIFTKIPVVALSTSFEAKRFSQLYHLPFEKVEKFGLRFYKYFISLTPYFEKKMKKTNPKVISTVIPEGVDTEFFKIKKKKPKHILFLGRFDMGQKGIDLLLRAYAKIADKAKYPLIIAGKGPDEKKILEMIQNLKLEKKVKMVGPAYGEKKEKLLSSSLYVAFPSRNETFSCFALEAFAVGLPIVGFDIPGTSWTGKETSKKVKPFNVNAYSQMLLKSMNEKEMAKTGQNAKKLAATYTWDKVCDEFEKFFISVLANEQRINENKYSIFKKIFGNILNKTENIYRS